MFYNWYERTEALDLHSLQIFLGTKPNLCGSERVLVHWMYLNLTIQT